MLKGFFMQYFASISWVTLVGLMLTSCQSMNHSEEESNNNGSFVTYTFDRYSFDCQVDSNRCARFTVNYPMLKSDFFVDSLVQKINTRTLLAAVESTGLEVDSNVSDLETQCTAFFNDYQEYLSFSTGQALPWTIEITGEVRYQDEQILNIAIQSYQFTGGAHPNGNTRFLNYDLETGYLLDWADILADSLDFIRLAEPVFRKVREIGPEVNLEKTGFFWGDSFRPPNNFSFEKGGLRLFYNTYEIAPYALGVTEFVLSYHDLEGVVKPKYLNFD